MYYRDEDPNRTGSPDDYFGKFISDLTGRDSDPDFFSKPTDSDNLPPMEQWEIDEAKREMDKQKKQVDYFMRRQINQFARSSEQRDAMLKQHGLEVE